MDRARARQAKNEGYANAMDLIEQKTGHEFKYVPVTTTLAEHDHLVTNFRMTLSRRFPEMSNKQSDDITRLARLAFWPGPSNDFNGMLWPNEYQDPEVRALLAAAHEEAKRALDGEVPVDPADFDPEA